MVLPEVNESALSDDGSYELVDSHESDDFGEYISAAKCEEKNHEEYSDVGTDDDYSKASTNDSDGSYEFVDSKEISEHMTQCKEDLCADDNNQRESIVSSDISADCYHNTVLKFSGLKTDDDISKGRKVQLRTLAYHSNPCILSANIDIRSKNEPKDILKDHVLHYLPAKSLTQFKAVSKEWNKWIAGPFLAHKQSHHFQKMSGFFRYGEAWCTFISLDKRAYGVPSDSLRFMPERFDIRSSCNGLLLCQGRNMEKTYYVCNPTNQEWIRLPEPKYYHAEDSKFVLAFEPSTLNFEARFQVICAISLPVFEGPIMFFEIYDSGTNSWSISSADCVELGDSVLIDDGFYLNGIAYWQTSSDELLAFDLKNEICGLQPLPYGTECIGLFDGEICFVRRSYEASTATRTLEIYGDFFCLKRTINIQVGSSSGWNGFQFLSPVGNEFAAMFLEDNNVNNVFDVTADVNGKYFPYVNSLVSVAYNK